jgi:hypothetical protein
LGILARFSQKRLHNLHAFSQAAWIEGKATHEHLHAQVAIRGISHAYPFQRALTLARQGPNCFDSLCQQAARGQVFRPLKA